jgi:hypothetical protein
METYNNISLNDGIDIDYIDLNSVKDEELTTKAGFLNIRIKFINFKV